jgi:DNA-binding transcriptional ArsR family regulator
MRVLNLSQPPSSVHVEVVYSAAAEMLMSILAIGHVSATPLGEEIKSYDLGRERLESLRRLASDDLLEDLERLFGGPGTLGESCGKLLSNLFGFVLDAESRDVAAFLRRLEAADATDVTLALVGYYTRSYRVVASDVIRNAVKGDDGARREFIEGARARWGQEDDLVQALDHVLALGPEAVHEGLVRALRRWDEEVFSRYADEALPVLERDYKAKLKMAQGQSLERTIELATNGIQFTPETGIGRVVLTPTYILKPWVLITEYREVDASLPPPQLVKLYKALGDASRLRLLQRIATGPMTLKEATELLASAKSTAYHHLAILRQAGLVWVREEANEDRTYTLRDDLIPQASELLQGYLRIQPAQRGLGGVPGDRVADGSG